MRLWIIVSALVALLLVAEPAAARIDAEALVGQPFGVGTVTISGLDASIDASRVLIQEKNGRVFYPTATPGVLGRILGQILGDPADRPASGVTINFLFRGEEPLELTVYTPQSVPLTVRPAAPANSRVYERQVAQWWRNYNASWRQLKAEDDHPPLVPTYLTAMLSQRLGLEAPLVERLQSPKEKPTQATQSLELLLGMERLRLDTMRETMLGRGDFGQPLELPLPAPPAWQPLALPAELAETPIEPMALHVPHEWFYVRFGKFSNYLWMDYLIDEYGGDISSMVTLRSYISALGDRAQDQLGLEKTILGDLLGDTVIADVAIVGSDTFTHEGGAIGMLFQARNTKILDNDITQQQKRALDKAKASGATAQILEIAGKKVSLVSTPDNRLRSFHVADGDFHLVTTSRAMVERFLRVNEGRGPLGKSAEFRYARQAMPLTRNDTIFAYFSSAFFEGLLSPQYQVELERRMKSVTDMELLQMARLAAIGEGVRGETLEDLTAAAFLPRGFGRRPDGSGPVITGTGIFDSRRGARGSFLPIPDVKIEGITRGEAQRVGALNAQLAQQWRRMDPLMVGIQRYALDDKGRERVTIDANVNPLDESKYGWVLSMLGPPTRQMITPAEGDVISLQAAVRGGLLFDSIPAHHLFLGVQDTAPLSAIPPSGLLQTFNFLRSTPGYIGSWPRAGFLDLLPFNLGGSTPDANGFSRLLFGLWRRQGAGFSVLSFDPQLLANITPQLRVAEAETEAQLRLHVADLSQSKIKPWITNLYYQRAITASAGNTRLLHQLNQQLHVPMDQAKEIAEDLLDGQFVCPLGGEYQLVEDIRGGALTWQSTAWAKRNLASIPEDFEAPLLKWFRGLDAHLIKIDGQITLHAELDMQRKPTAPKIELPLPFFNNLFGGGQKALKAKKDPKNDELPPPLPPVKDPPKADPPKIELPGARDLGALDSAGVLGPPQDFAGLLAGAGSAVGEDSFDVG